MEIITYKTNIRSEKAVQKVTPYLNRAVGSANWQIDIRDSNKTLSVFSPAYVNEQQVLNAVHVAGFSAMNIDDYYSVY